MLLTQTAEYALRAMSCLAEERALVLSSDQLSQQAAIPRHYVSKVMRQLVVAGLVTARRGRGGGFRLVRAPEHVTFAEVIEAVGGKLDPDRCAFGHDRCNASDPCPLHDSYIELQAVFNEWASRTTLDRAAAHLPDHREST